jgi:hypothetical protein
MTEGKNKTPTLVAVGDPFATEGKLTEGTFWFSRTLPKAILTDEEFNEWCTKGGAVTDRLIQATKRRGTYPPPKFAKAVRNYTEHEIQTMGSAVTHAYMGSAQRPKKVADVNRMDVLIIENAWAAKALAYFQTNPRKRLKRLESTLRALRSLRSTLAELRSEDFASLRFLDIDVELYAGEPELIGEIWERMRIGEEWLSWLQGLIEAVQHEQLPKMPKTKMDRFSRPIDVWLDGMIRRYADAWHELGSHPKVWCNKYTSEYQGDFWIFVRTAIQPFFELLGEKASDGALFSRIERICRSSPATEEQSN